MFCTENTEQGQKVMPFRRINQTIQPLLLSLSSAASGTCMLHPSPGVPSPRLPPSFFPFPSFFLAARLQKGAKQAKKAACYHAILPYSVHTYSSSTPPYSVVSSDSPAAALPLSLHTLTPTPTPTPPLSSSPPPVRPSRTFKKQKSG